MSIQKSLQYIDNNKSGNFLLDVVTSYKPLTVNGEQTLEEKNLTHLLHNQSVQTL